jgi:hypothetical protein
MIVEVFVDTPLPGADWAQIMKKWLAIMKRMGVTWRLLTPESGALNRVLHVVEWASFADRERFYSKLTEAKDAQSVLATRKDYFDVSAFEHHYYNVVELAP